MHYFFDFLASTPLSRTKMLKIFFLIVLFGSEISSASQAAVVGSINVDLVLPQSPSNMSFFPKPGETTTIPSTKLLPGGKGLNQAFALAKLGVNVSFNGNVGDDVHGDFIKTLLAASSLNSTLNTIPSASTGVGVVFLPRSGDASAIVSTGANGCWERVPHLPCISTSTSVLLLQREIPEETNILLAKQAAKANCPTFLDCGGSNKPISNELLSLVTFVSPNLSELGSLTSAKCSTTTSCILAAKQLISRGAKNVLVTRGSLPSILITDSDSDTPVITPPITDAALTVVDTTGAGDCFKAAFCFFHFIEKLPIQKALEFASLSGFLACTKVGVTSSPTISDLTATMLKLRGGEQIPKKEKFKFASRLNSFRDKHPSLPLLTWIELQGKIPSLSLIDFNYPQHLPPLTNSSLSEISSALKTADLKTGAVCLRFPSSMQGGAFTNPDEGIRAQAIQLTEEACEWAMKLNANEVVVWSAFCGYDYAMQADYNVLFDKTKEAFQQVCDKFPAVKVSLEFKPTDENTRFFAIPSTGAAVVLADAVSE